MVVVGDAQGRGIGSSRSCTVPGKAESWTLGTNRLQLQQTCRGCRVKRRDQRTETKPAGRTEPSAIFDARRGIKSISGVRGAGRPTCERDCTHREKLCAICVGAEQRYTNGCRAVERGGTSKNSVVCRARQCAYVMRREPPCGQTASMHCSRVLSVVGCKSSVGNQCVFSCVTVRERAELFLNRELIYARLDSRQSSRV